MIEALIDWLQHERVTRRIAAGLAVGLCCLVVAWAAGYLLLPEGALRGRTGAGAISVLLGEHASVFDLALLWNAAVAFVVVPLVCLLAIKRLCLGYILAWGYLALFGIFLGTHSFGTQRSGPVAPGFEAFASTGAWEIAAYLLVAAALANRYRFRQSGWLGGTTTRVSRTRTRLTGGQWVTLLVAACLVVATAWVEGRRASSARASQWVRAFGYSPTTVHSIEVGEFGYPYVPVDVAGTRLMLAFDTGNMVGVSVSSELFDRIGLTGGESWERRSSTGEIVSSLRVADDVDVRVLGRAIGPTRVYELDPARLAGLVGPAALGGGHFTLDYASRRMALATGGLPGAVPGFRKIALVRSVRHPMLILVRGTVEGRPVLLECDTGKSRTVINPALASELGLKRGPRGVAIESLSIGDLSFEVPSAKEVDQTGIDPDLPQPIMGGVGSDLLARFVWTVDYDNGVLWIPSP